MDVKEKTNDNIKVIMDLALYCECQNMKLFNDGLRITKLKVIFASNNDAQFLINK